MNPVDFLLRQPYPKPIYKITVDGRDISPEFRARMGDLTLTDNRGFEADQLDIRLDDSDGKLDIPPRGAEVRLWLGFEASGLVDKGTLNDNGLGTALEFEIKATEVVD